MKNPLLVPELREMLDAGNLDTIREFCETTPPSVVADFLGALSAKENRTIFKHLDPDLRSKIFSYIDDEVKLALLSLVENSEAVELVAHMHTEERVQFINLLPKSKKLDIRGIALNTPGEEASELADEIDLIIRSEGPVVEELTEEEIAEEMRPLVRIYVHDGSGINIVKHRTRDCWINITAPPKDAIPYLGKYLGIPHDFITASLDIDETSRIETEGATTLLIFKAPFFDQSFTDVPYFTIPIGVILHNGMVITVCSRDDSILNDFVTGKVRNLTSFAGPRFVLQVLLRATLLYLKYLRQINNAASVIQSVLEQESRNKQLIKLMNLEKSLVYFTTSLKSNVLMLEKFQRLDIFNLTPSQRDLFDDIVIETKQALEMGNVYSDILSGMMDAFASIISNNLNIVVKILTSITLILMIPNIITGFYGMNIALPFQDHPLAYLGVMGITILLSGGILLYFIRKNWL